MRTGLIAKALLWQLLLAPCVSQVWAAPCVAPPASPEAIDQFKANPEALIAPNADARSIEALVRDLAGTDASLATDLARLAQHTTPRFRTAIAAGLAQAAISCSTADQQASLLIQQAVAGVEDAEFQASFAAVSGDLSTAATEAALTSASSSVGSVIIVNPTKSQGLTAPRGGGGSPSLVQITAGTVTTRPATPTSPTTTAASPVSATR